MKAIIFLIFAFSLLPFHLLRSQWFQQAVLTDMNIPLSIDFYNLNIGVTCGRNDFNGKIVFTTNSGSNWIAGQLPDSTRACVTVQFVNSETAYIAGAYNVNNNRKQIKERIAYRHAKLLQPLLIFLSRIGHDLSVDYKGQFLKTTNGGVNWYNYGQLPDSIYYLIGLHFLNEATGFVTGDKSQTAGIAAILKTTDGGMSWVYQIIPQGVSTLRKIMFLDLNTGFAVGYRQISDTTFQSVVLRTTNGGTLWSEINIPGIENIESIDFANGTTGFITGSNPGIQHPVESVIYKSTNTGVSWFQSSQMIAGTISGVEFVNGAGTGMAYASSDVFSDSCFIIRTTNFGGSWIFQYMMFNVSFLTESCIIDPDNWFLCGGGFSASGIILKTTNGGGPIGVKPEGSNIPADFKLHQNYPNPFNANTIINYELRITSYVILAVYDITGKEIITLVNEEQDAGTYEVDFSGNDLSSGIYFYEMIAGGHTESKKMVLLK